MDHLTRMARGDVVSNAAYIHKANTLQYSQVELCEHGYRRDCTGWMSECFRIPAHGPGSWGGVNTETMVADMGGWQYFTVIPAADLRQADVVAIAGPGTGGFKGGHVRVFDKWSNDDPNDNSYWAYEQAWGSHGPDYRLHDDLAEAGRGIYRAYRYVAIADDQTPAPEPPAPSGVNYVVGEGDTMVEIAGRLGVDVDDLIDLNLTNLDAVARKHGRPDSAGGHWIYPETVLAVPSTIDSDPGTVPDDRIIEVVFGDTLASLGARYGVTATALYERNADVIEAAARSRNRPSSRRGHWIYPGTRLIIP